MIAVPIWSVAGALPAIVSALALGLALRLVAAGARSARRRAGER